MDRLPLRKKIFYGTGGVSMALPDVILMQWLLVRYLPTDSEPLIPAALMGAIFFLERLTEGVSNPFLAHWSDSLKHRWGRRQPFMRLGILPYLILYVLLFHPPVNGTSWMNAVYLIVVSQCYAMLFAGMFTAYLALMPEITSNLQDRIDLTTSQALFLMIAQIVFVAMGALIGQFGWTLPILGVAGLVGLCFIPPMTLREPARETQQAEREGAFQAIISAFGNRAFVIVGVATGLYFFMLSGMIALLPFWVKGFLGLDEMHVTLAMGPFLGVTIVFFAVFNVLARKFAKHLLLQITFLGSAALLLLFQLIGHVPGAPFIQTAVLVALLGAPAAGFMVLPNAILADVIDYDERRTGRRREALFFGVQGVVQKILLGLSMLSFTLAPYVTGAGMDSASTLRFMAALCAIACFGAFLVFTRYPLRERDGVVFHRGKEAEREATKT